MAFQNVEIISQDKQVRNRWIYPPGCPTSQPDDVVTATWRYYKGAEYVRESRPKPKVLITSMTPRERVEELEVKNGEYWTEVQFPCPHNGAHGLVTLQSHTVGVSGWNRANMIASIDFYKDQLMWAGKLRDKIGNQQVNLGSSLAEYRESCKMFAGLARGLFNAYRVIRLKQPRKRRLTARDIPASVLAYNFGVAPLVNDVYSSVEMLRLRIDKPVVQRISASIKRGFDLKEDRYGFTHTSNAQFRQRATIYISRSNFAGLNGDFDFGNPIEWAWELIPFSFVVDWAIPIGEWLSQLDAMVGNTLLSGSLVTKTQAKTSYYKVGATNVVSPGSGVAKSYERDLITSVPFARFPGWTPSMSWRRAVNATSLLWLLSGRLRKK